ncbi:MAG TPA: sugar phosphate isomerase/epimerase family protein [Luteitalea sp.]|nr:sugar phosphate isomerase/epimerase family protein [Luteitalea sp.]
MHRRGFLSRAAALGAALPTSLYAQASAPAQPTARTPEPNPAPQGLPLTVRVGMTDWNLGKRGDITKIALAREVGLDGIQVSLTFPTDGTPHLRQPETQLAFKRAALEHGVQICSLAIGNPGKSRLPFHTNPASAVLLVEAVEVARNLGTTNILLPILGDSHIDMTSQAQVDTFVAMMKEVARYAEKAGVVIALEDWISAEDNLRLLDAIGSDFVGVYYDARNIKARLHDPYGEPGKLGKRIDQIHVKNGQKLLGEPELIDWTRLSQEYLAIGYRGWYVLETGSPSGDFVADTRANIAYVRKTFRMPA